MDSYGEKSTDLSVRCDSWSQSLPSSALYSETRSAGVSPLELDKNSPVTVRTSQYGDQIVLKQCYRDSMDVARGLLKIGSERSCCNQSTQHEVIAKEDGTKFAYHHPSAPILTNYRRSFTSMGQMEMWNGTIAKIPGEVVHFESENELLTTSHVKQILVKAVLTNYRLVFIPKQLRFSRKLRDDALSIPILSISKLEKHGDKKSRSYFDISVKDGRKFKLVFSTEDYCTFLKSQEVLERIMSVTKLDEHFAFLLFEEDPSLESTFQGWSFFNFDAEFKRQGLDLSKEGNYKKVKNLKGDEPICETYPSEFIVPASMTAKEIILCAKFRSRKRLPALVYCYNSSHNKRATLWRSSQCKSGWYESRCEEDELMVRLIGDPTNRSNCSKPTINVKIFDARPYLNAMANKVHGKGYENTSHYKNAEISFMDIENIHAVRDSYKKLIHTCTTELDSDKFWISVASSGWCEHLSQILKAARLVIEESLNRGISALVHCSDGWDRTVQITSLVQIIVDPYFRTLRGFEVLVEKDWVHYGHQFRLRSGFCSKDEKDQRAPIFLQFLDCVHQLIQQFPFAFEFNTKLLSDLYYYSQTSLFGTFLCNSSSELEKYSAHTKTISIWSFLESRRTIYMNSWYDCTDVYFKHNNGKILPSTRASVMRFWREHFLYYHEEASPFRTTDVNITSKWDIFEAKLKAKDHENQHIREDNDRLNECLAQLVAENTALKQKLEENTSTTDYTENQSPIFRVSEVSPEVSDFKNKGSESQEIDLLGTDSVLI